MADDDPVDRPRPDQAEEPVVDVGASNVDLDEARHGPAHESPAEPEAGHEPAHDVPGHDVPGHDPVESPGWVLVPLAIGVLVAVLLLVLFGLDSGASPAESL